MCNVKCLRSNSPPAEATSGFVSRQELTEHYATTTGRDLSEIDYYRAFSHWRLVAIAHGAYKRYLAGAMGENRDADADADADEI